MPALETTPEPDNPFSGLRPKAPPFLVDILPTLGAIGAFVLTLVFAVLLLLAQLWVGPLSTRSSLVGLVLSAIVSVALWNM